MSLLLPNVMVVAGTLAQPDFRSCVAQRLSRLVPKWNGIQDKKRS
jgi:hypothetical protein